MITINTSDTNAICRLLEMVTRLQPGALPSAMDQANARDLGRRIRNEEVGQLNGQDRLSRLFEAMRKDGQGLTLGQEVMIRQEIGG